jgi:hypothetical protein
MVKDHVVKYLSEYSAEPRYLSIPIATLRTR